MFKPDAACDDAKGPPGSAGLNPDSIGLLSSRTAMLNDVLVGGAEKYEFTVARPVLAPLCEPVNEQIGADLQGLDDAQPFHPTAVGIIRMAASVVRVIAPPSDRLSRARGPVKVRPPVVRLPGDRADRTGGR